MKLTEREKSILINALYITKELWEKDMQTTRDDGFERLAKHFAQCVIEAEDLIKRLEN